jgi:hypothetical protein
VIDRINESVARRLGGAGTSVASFVRIHLWAVAFLVALSLILPNHPANVAKNGGNRKIDVYLHDIRGQTNVNVRSLALDTNDPRAFAPSPFGKERFHIAWITGSEGQVFSLGPSKIVALGSFTFVAELAAQRLPFLGGRQIVVDLYYLPAMRLGDSYITLLHAIKSKPDMIVFDLNPAWVLNPLAVHQWAQLDQIGATELATKPEQWPLGASLFSPSALMWGAAASTLGPIRDRAYYGTSIHDQVDSWGPLRRRPKDAVSDAPSLAQTVLTMSPADFWFQYRFNEKRTPDAEFWAKVLGPSLGGGGPLNRTLLSDIGKALKDSKIPSYVYLAQTNSTWLTGDKQIRTAIDDIEGQLEKLRGDFAASNIVYQPRTLSRYVHNLSFLRGDLVHLVRADSLGPYIAGQLCRLAVRSGYNANCAAVGKAPGNG